MDIKSSQNKKFLQGHRKRVKEKILKNGISTFADYELLEVILYFVYPRKDTKNIAKELLANMHSFKNILSSDASKLIENKNIGESCCVYFTCLHELFCRICREDIKKTPLLNNVEKVIDYCSMRMSCLLSEQLRIIYLNTKHFLIKDEIQQNGSIDHTAIYPREIIKNALNIGAKGIIIVHNHPSGDPSPSIADIQITQKIMTALSYVDIKFYDHIIIGKGKNFSMKREKVVFT